MSSDSAAQKSGNGLSGVVQNEGLKWVFVGGKGGVGKTTTSCALAYAFSQQKRVTREASAVVGDEPIESADGATKFDTLLISTDPAHNLSDALGQKIGPDPTEVRAAPGLAAMEVEMQGAFAAAAARQDADGANASDPASSAMLEMFPPQIREMLLGQGGTRAGNGESGGSGGAFALVKQLIDVVPGIDEAMAFAVMMQRVLDMGVSRVVFDTAPTGHTLRMLAFPALMKQAVEKFQQLHERFRPMLESVSAIMGGGPNGAGGIENIERQVSAKLEQLRATVDRVVREFRDSSMTTFVAVCIAEFLSVYETERLVQQLGALEIHVSNIVLNQLLDVPSTSGSSGNGSASSQDAVALFDARMAIQRKYVEQLYELYAEDFHLTEMPLFSGEIRGEEMLSAYAAKLVTPRSSNVSASAVGLDEELLMESSLRNVVEQQSLKWIFVGGKGGVGKTTTSCALAVALHSDAVARGSDEKILIISTDPAHNLSDAFGEKISCSGGGGGEVGEDGRSQQTATKLSRFSQLYALEIDPTDMAKRMMAQLLPPELVSPEDASRIATSIPGIDEAVGFAHMMELASDLSYSKIIFDTAPTGHTLRLLEFPARLQQTLSKLDELRAGLGPMLNLVGGLGGLPPGVAGGGPGGGSAMDAVGEKIEELKVIVERVGKQMADPEQTTFVAVAIAELLSVYETERLVQQLSEVDMDVRNVVINQLMEARKESDKVPLLRTRAAMQKKYIAQLQELYPAPEFTLTRLHLLPIEVRGIARIHKFAQLCTEMPLPEPHIVAPSSSTR